MAALCRRGDWQPTTNRALLLVQLVALFQAALRGTNYLSGDEEPSAALAAVESAAAQPVWGGLFYGSVVLAVLGMALRYSPPIVLGHLLLFAWYAGLGGRVISANLDAIPPASYLGLGIGAVGAWGLVSSRVTSAAVRMFVAVPLLLGGQWVLSAGLGDDYRTGTGLIGAGLLHLIIGVGVAVAVARRHLLRLVDQEQATASRLPTPEG